MRVDQDATAPLDHVFIDHSVIDLSPSAHENWGVLASLPDGGRYGEDVWGLLQKHRNLFHLPFIITPLRLVFYL